MFMEWVVCCAAGIGGDMIQDLKVGHILGGTPWKMEVGEIIGVIVASLVLIWPMIALDEVYHIGSAELPAPQAGLMALMARGIVDGEMAWPLVVSGVFFALALILIKAPSPMLIAVGMYLPFYSTAAIFVGGSIRWVLDLQLKQKRSRDPESALAVNTGILLSSGLIAGEALMAVLLAFLVLGANLMEWGRLLPQISSNVWLGMLLFPLLIYLLVRIPLKAMKRRIDPGVELE